MATSPDLRAQLEELCRRYGVASLYVFGSRAGEMAARLEAVESEPTSTCSDVDLAVHPKPAGLQVELEELLGVSRVDLVVLPEASGFLAADAVRGELLYCGDEDRQAREEPY